MAGLAAALLLAAVVPSAHAVGGVSDAANGGGLKLGVWDGAFLSDDPATRAQWLDRTAGVGATQVTIEANWRNIAGARPADPTDPSDPAYDWVLLDAAVRDATARGLSVMLMLFQAPDWAEGPSPAPPANAIPGSRRPSPRSLGQFARALASRYSGEFPDPLAPGRSLPRVTLWQIWGEPNYGRNLNPQWERSGGKWRPAGPEHFRKMINAAYSSLKDVDRSNRVIAGGLLPVGDYKRGGDRFEPLRFLREFFCLRGRRALKPKKCPGKKPHLDVLGHNPLSFGVSAFEPAARPDDVWPPDMHKLTRVIRAARAHRRIVPRRGTELWVTELLALSEPAVRRQPDHPGELPCRRAVRALETRGLTGDLGWDQGRKHRHRAVRRQRESEARLASVPLPIRRSREEQESGASVGNGSRERGRQHRATDRIRLAGDQDARFERTHLHRSS